jgi:hypothetical protein
MLTKSDATANRPKQYVRNAPVGKADRHQECFRRGPNSTVSADLLGEFSLEKNGATTANKEVVFDDGVEGADSIAPR